MKPTLNQTNQEQTSTIKKWLTSEVKFVILVIGFVWGVAVPYFGIRQDIALIKENHMSHIEAFDKELVEIKGRQEKQDDTIIKLMQTLSKLER